MIQVIEQFIVNYLHISKCLLAYTPFQLEESYSSTVFLTIFMQMTCNCIPALIHLPSLPSIIHSPHLPCVLVIYNPGWCAICYNLIVRRPNSLLLPHRILRIRCLLLNSKLVMRPLNHLRKFVILVWSSIPAWPCATKSHVSLAISLSTFAISPASDVSSTLIHVMTLFAHSSYPDLIMVMFFFWVPTPLISHASKLFKIGLQNWFFVQVKRTMLLHCFVSFIGCLYGIG